MPVSTEKYLFLRVNAEKVFSLEASGDEGEDGKGLIDCIPLEEEQRQSVLVDLGSLQLLSNLGGQGHLLFLQEFWMNFNEGNFKVAE